MIRKFNSKYRIPEVGSQPKHKKTCNSTIPESRSMYIFYMYVCMYERMRRDQINQDNFQVGCWQEEKNEKLRQIRMKDVFDFESGVVGFV